MQNESSAKTANTKNDIPSKYTSQTVCKSGTKLTPKYNNFLLFRHTSLFCLTTKINHIKNTFH